MQGSLWDGSQPYAAEDGDDNWVCNNRWQSNGADANQQ